MSETITVFWLLIYASMAAAQPPVFLPEPFATEEQCVTAGEVFKDSPLDRLEFGRYVCLPQPKTVTN